MEGELPTGMWETSYLQQYVSDIVGQEGHWHKKARHEERKLGKRTKRPKVPCWEIQHDHVMSETRSSNELGTESRTFRISRVRPSANPPIRQSAQLAYHISHTSHPQAYE
jgi:hypothetical protein